MKKFKAIVFALLWSILVICFPVISGVIVTINEFNEIDTILTQGIFMMVCFVLAILIIILTRRKIKTGYLNNSIFTWLLYLPTLLALIPTSIMGFTWKGISYFGVTLFLYFFVGLTEEIYFRFFVIEELKKEFKEGYVILISTILFGLGHASTAFSGTDGLMTVLIIINALIFGFMASTLVLKTKNIVPLMIIHFLFDFESKFIVIEGLNLAIAEFIRGFLMLLISVIYLVYFYKKEKNEINEMIK